MSEFLVKKIFDIQNNRVQHVTVEPSQSTGGGGDWMTIQFHPAGSTERYYYTSDPIVPDPSS